MILPSRSPMDTILWIYTCRAYAEAFLEMLEHGDDNEKRELYYNERDYVRKIKERLDKLDAVSRKPNIKAVRA